MGAALGDMSSTSRTRTASTHTGQVSLERGIGAQALRWSQRGRQHSHAVRAHGEQMTWASTCWGDLSSTSDPLREKRGHPRTEC